MNRPLTIDSVSIRPDVGILSVLRHLNYRPWFALAEFVDNALESYLSNLEEVKRVDGPAAKLRVEIEIETGGEGRISIRDNAAGIYQSEYQRAFRAAEPPPSASGLSEFGMGMKSAACWFGRRFVVRSSALGEPVERAVEFDIEDIVHSKSETLPVEEVAAAADQHFTEVVLSNLHKAPQGRTIGKIKEHLASIYREYLRDGTLDIRFRSTGIDELLSYEEPEVLVASPDEALIRRRGLSAEPREWRKPIEFDFGGDLKVRGFAALRRRGSTSKAGLALFRRKRLIEGSGEDSYRPSRVFGASTTAIYQRLFGELHLEGFSVSHTKDGFKWDENEEPFLDLLREELNADPLPLLDQAREASYGSIREGQDGETQVAEAVEEAVRDTAEIMRDRAAPIIQAQIDSALSELVPPASLPVASQSWQESFDIELHGSNWHVAVEVTNDPAVGEWVGVFDTGRADDQGRDLTHRYLGVRLSLAHPFMVRFVGTDLDRVKPFVRLAAAIGLAEITASEAGVKHAGELRRNINQLMRDAMSRA